MSGPKKLMGGQKKGGARGMSMMDVERKEESQADNMYTCMYMYVVMCICIEELGKNSKSDRCD